MNSYPKADVWLQTHKKNLLNISGTMNKGILSCTYMYMYMLSLFSLPKLSQLIATDEIILE